MFTFYVMLEGWLIFYRLKITCFPKSVQLFKIVFWCCFKLNKKINILFNMLKFFKYIFWRSWVEVTHRPIISQIYFTIFCVIIFSGMWMGLLGVGDKARFPKWCITTAPKYQPKPERPNSDVKVIFYHSLPIFYCHLISSNAVYIYSNLLIYFLNFPINRQSSVKITFSNFNPHFTSW